jgi:hypothetical protein
LQSGSEDPGDYGYEVDYDAGWASTFGELGVCDSSDDFDDPTDLDWG